MLEFNLKQLEAFAAAAELGSFTKAAQSLYLTQSTVSAHIQTLERALGVPLFVRDAKKKIQLTDSGKLLYPYAKDILERCQSMQALLQTGDGQEELTIAASTVPCQCILPELMASFLQSHPGSRYRLQKGDSGQVHDLLAHQSVRIGFVGTMLDDSQYTYQPLVRDKLVVLTANTPHFQDLRRQGVLGRELLSEPMISRERGSGTRDRFNAYLERLGIDARQLNIVAQIDLPETILRAVEAGVGVTVYSELAAGKQLLAGSLLAFDLDQTGLYRELYLVSRRRTILSPLERAFWEFTCAQYASV